MAPEPQTDIDDLTTLQRRLVYEVSGTPDGAAVLFADHPRAITIGREGSRLQVRRTDDELTAHSLPLRFVPRGGGAMLHLPGQVTCYPILPLAAFGVTPGEYVRTLVRVTARVVAASGLPAEPSESEVTVRVRGRRVAHIGVAVRGGVSLFGVVLNVCPDLDLFRFLDADGDPTPMTSMQRECDARVTPLVVRQRMANALSDAFSLRRVLVPNRRPHALIHLTRHALAQRVG